ncbi:carboxymuconolactone decarboxylase family protein [Labedaea rhizosphaerae]|uniref:AhpD family alkylhydroperoxidase n=1 Tax=Labedaea rhizosphaerae TaxID=598644 RepID=A0A4R6SFS8_LABRH|nr:carboxymuconolactone decarboxylase family protein [Labedaea rhizosphaerae]TDP97966.1 AhpD family alkylhydroperoxidase [Labedaea rhizosphaerae]
MSRLTLAVLGALGNTQVKYVRPVRFGAAQGLVAEVYRQIERDFGVLAPPMTLHSPAPAVLAGAWSMLRETMLVPGHVDRVVKEAMATAVSVANTCPFCVTVHGSTYGGMTGNSVETIDDPAVTWARASVHADTAASAGIPFTAAQAPEYLGLVTMMQYLNRMANVFLGEVPLPPGTPRLALGGVMGVLVGLIKSAAGTEPAPGRSLALLPEASLPAELGWAAAAPTVAGAMAKAAAAVEEAGSRAAPAQVRDLVRAELAGWRGEPKGISRAWVDHLVAALPTARRPAARLALLVAFASYQVDKRVVADFRRTDPSDATLVELAAWSAMAAARRIGEWAAPSDSAEPGYFEP